jgi:Bacterial SH3 domain
MHFARIAASTAALIALSASYTQAAPALATSDVKLRQGPGTNYRIVGTLPGGSTVEVSGCRGRWCTIVWQGRRAYVTAASLAGGTAPGGPGPGLPPGPPPMYPPGAYPLGYEPPPVVDYPGFEFGPRSAHYYGAFGGYGPYWPNRWWW